LKIETTTTVEATKARVIEYMTSPDYLLALCDALEAVSAIEETVRDEDGAGLKRTLRYTAPTRSKIPGFLKRYEDKAPEFVFWDERGSWDTAAGRFAYEIVPEIPEAWHKYYTTSGRVDFSERDGRTTLKTTLEYGVEVFGLKRVIERALKPEVEKILELQGELVLKHFQG